MRQQPGEFSMDVTTIIIDIIAGAIGGNIAAVAIKQYTLGTAGNSIAGLIGGVIGGWIILKLFGGAMPAATEAAGAAVSSGMSAGQIIAQIIGALIGGAILQLIAGAIKQQTAKA